MLITCPECGNSVSDKAEMCPHCGCPKSVIHKQFDMIPFDTETMTGKTQADNDALEVAFEFYGDLLVSADGRVWNYGGQVVAEMKYKEQG